MSTTNILIGYHFPIHIFIYFTCYFWIHYWILKWDTHDWCLFFFVVDSVTMLLHIMFDACFLQLPSRQNGSLCHPHMSHTGAEKQYCIRCMPSLCNIVNWCSMYIDMLFLLCRILSKIWLLWFQVWVSFII